MSNRFAFVFTALGLAGSVVTADTTAVAQSQGRAPSSRAVQEARQNYDLGVQGMRAGRPAEALVYFERAYELRPNPIVLISIALTQQQLDRIPQAIATLERYLHEWPEAPDRAHIESRIAELRRTPAAVRVASEPAGARIMLDGENSGRTTPAEVTLAPGSHSIRLELTGYATSERRLELEPGAHQDVSAPLERIAAVPVATPPAETAPTPAVQPAVTLTVNERTAPVATPGRGLSTPSVVAFGIAGGAAVAGIISGGVAYSYHESYLASPSANAADRGEAAAIAADVFIGVTVVSAAVGVIVYLVHDRAGEPRREQRSRLAPNPTIVPGGLVLRF